LLSSFNVVVIERPISGARKRLAAGNGFPSLSGFCSNETIAATLIVC